MGNPFDPNDFVNNCAIPRLLFNLSGGSSGSDAPSRACLGSATGPGFGWQDMDVVKLGYQYRFGAYKFRLGYSWTEQPIPSNEILFNVLAPGVVEKHYTAGVAWQWTDNLAINTAFTYVPDRPVRGRNPLSNTDANPFTLGGSAVGAVDTSESFGHDPDDQEIVLNMKQFELSVGLSWRY